jgi:hypothetical protein
MCRGEFGRKIKKAGFLYNELRAQKNPHFQIILLIEFASVFYLGAVFEEKVLDAMTLSSREASSSFAD